LFRHWQEKIVDPSQEGQFERVEEKMSESEQRQTAVNANLIAELRQFSE
jgi:hypothetical protein